MGLIWRPLGYKCSSFIVYEQSFKIPSVLKKLTSFNTVKLNSGFVFWVSAGHHSVLQL